MSETFLFNHMIIESYNHMKILEKYLQFKEMITQQIT